MKIYLRDGLGQFFCHQIGFRVLRSYSGWVSGDQELLRVSLGSNFFIILQSILPVFDCIWQKICNIYEIKNLCVTRVLKKNSSGWVLARPIPTRDPYYLPNEENKKL